jgi:para-nitrobenzyl esterase
MHRRLRAPTSLGSEADRIIELFQKNRPHATPAEIYFTITAMPLVAIKQAEQKAAQGNAEMVGTGPDIQPLADKVSATWAALRTGNPNNSDIPHWPPYNSAERSTMVIDNQWKVVKDPNREERLAMEKLPPRSRG